MKHDRDFDPNYGNAVEIQPGIRRLTAKNPSPFTFRGTNTYLLGTKKIVCVDPGPNDSDHIDLILDATDGAQIETILVTHTHADHSPGARLLQERTGARIIGCAPYQLTRHLGDQISSFFQASNDCEYSPEVQLLDGDIFEASEFDLQALETPGHAANHLCYAILGTDILLSADHVMGWSTSIVAPPDGDMRDYLNSLDKLIDHHASTYLPGHGGIIKNAKQYVKSLRAHRLDREQAILDQIRENSKRISQIVDILYPTIDHSLTMAASLSVFAHLEDLVNRQIAIAEPSLSLEATFSSASS